MRLSVVTSLYRSAPYVDELHRRLTASVRRLSITYEIILVNDASPDESLMRASTIAAQDAHVRVIDLKRNVGQHRAILTGVALSRGRSVFILDSDLEESPEWIIRYYTKQLCTDADIVYGVSFAHQDRGILHAIGARLFYFCMNRLYLSPGPSDQVMARLMSRGFVDALVGCAEERVECSCLCATTCGRRATIPVWKRYKGTSSYTWTKRVGLLWTCLLLADKPWIRRGTLPLRWMCEVCECSSMCSERSYE